MPLLGGFPLCHPSPGGSAVGSYSGLVPRPSVGRSHTGPGVARPARRRSPASPGRLSLRGPPRAGLTPGVESRSPLPPGSRLQVPWGRPAFSASRCPAALPTSAFPPRRVPALPPRYRRLRPPGLGRWRLPGGPRAVARLLRVWCILLCAACFFRHSASSLPQFTHAGIRTVGPAHPRYACGRLGRLASALLVGVWPASPLLVSGRTERVALGPWSPRLPLVAAAPGRHPPDAA